MYKLSERSLKRLDGIHPVLLRIIKAGIKNSPYDFGIPREGGLRSAEDQHILYLKGASKCDGYKQKSYHQTGKAFDIYAYVDGKASWNPNHLRAIAKHLKEVAKDLGVNLIWGGDWTHFVDMPHFELR